MAVTLMDRLLGVADVNPDSPAEERKIDVSAFIGAMRERMAGEMTENELVTMFSLNVAQRNKAREIRALAVAAPNKAAFFQLMSQIVHIGNNDECPARYTGQPYFMGRLQQEVTEQGGTLP